VDEPISLGPGEGIEPDRAFFERHDVYDVEDV
jgi:hypothetical protein